MAKAIVLTNQEWEFLQTLVRENVGNMPVDCFQSAEDSLGAAILTRLVEATEAAEPPALTGPGDPNLPDPGGFYGPE